MTVLPQPLICWNRLKAPCASSPRWQHSIRPTVAGKGIAKEFGGRSVAKYKFADGY
jgi:hypothetical protein